MNNIMKSNTVELISIIFVWIVAGIFIVVFGNITMLILAITITARRRKPVKELITKTMEQNNESN